MVFQENKTSHTLSVFKLSINQDTTFFAASIRDGSKSLESILKDTSNAITISIHFLVISVWVFFILGLANNSIENNNINKIIIFFKILKILSIVNILLFQFKKISLTQLYL